MKKIPEKLKNSAPEGTAWYGGPVDRSKVSLRVCGEDLNPPKISALLACEPSEGKKKEHPAVGRREIPISRTGQWTLESQLPDETDLEEKVWDILRRLSPSQEVWNSLTAKYRVDLLCGVFLETQNRGFSLSVKLMRELSRLGIAIGFDICEP
jgi:hypothetical protein